MQKALYIFLILFALSSCEKDISVDIPDPESRIVVEGFIEQGLPPRIILTKNAPYFASLSPNELNKYAITDAKVTLSDGNSTYELNNEFLGGVKLPSYTNLLVTGKVGTIYKLTVEAEGTTVSAYTLIPKPIPLDSVFFELDNGSDSLGLLKCHLTDPDTLGNFYRFFTKRFSKDPQFYTTEFSSVFEDKIVNGSSFDFSLRRGMPPNSTEEGEGRGRFRLGDTIVLKWCTIDKAHFQFWQTLERSNNSNGNPFAAPVSIKSNINGGLGIWGGYGSSYDTIIAR